MVRVLCIVPLALAAVSAVSGHVIRRQHKSPPSGWQTGVLQNYDQYHGRYLEWGCQKHHDTPFFDKCCHPLLNGESITVLENQGCGCDDGDSSASPTTTTSSSTQPAQAYTSSAPTPAKAAVAHGDDTPTPSSSSSVPPTTPTSTPSTSPTSPPAKTGGSGKGNGSGSDGGPRSGQGTFFYQNGNAGACGTVHQDSDYICAIDSDLYSQSLCGKSVLITNTDNDKSVTVVVADECPTCVSAGSVDLSVAAFKSIGDPNKGVLSIKWEFV